MKWLVAIAVIGAVASVACGRTQQTEYYGLAATKGAARSYAGPPVRLEAVQVPPALDGPQMVRRSTQYSIYIAQHERWSDALGYLMRQAIAQDLVSRLPDGALIYPDAPKPPGALGVTLDVLQLTEMDGTLTLDASWTVLATNPPHIAARHHKTWTEKVTGSAESTSEGLSRVLARLADDIADALPADAAAASGS